MRSIVFEALMAREEKERVRLYEMSTGNFPNKLKVMMYHQGLNQLQLAGLLGVRQSQVSNWVNCKSLPGMHSLLQLARVFKCEIEEFYRKPVD